jgi:hypothetical protein
VAGGYCPDTRYEEKLQEKGVQHKALEKALKDCDKNVTTLPITLEQPWSQYRSSEDCSI